MNFFNARYATIVVTVTLRLLLEEKALESTVNLSIYAVFVETFTNTSVITS